jgi:hypothetical protein
MQHFVFELTHPSLHKPIVLHSKGKFDPPSEDSAGVFWFSARDAPDEILDGSPAQPSRQVLPVEPLTSGRPMNLCVTFNGHRVFMGSAAEWSYDDSQHQCFMRFGPLFALHCNEVTARPRYAFERYWRDINDPRYVGIVEIAPSFFTPTVVSLFHHNV